MQSVCLNLVDCDFLGAVRQWRWDGPLSVCYCQNGWKIEKKFLASSRVYNNSHPYPERSRCWLLLPAVVFIVSIGYFYAMVYLYLLSFYLGERQKKVNDTRRGPPDEVLVRREARKKTCQATATLTALLLICFFPSTRSPSLRGNCSLPSNKLVFPMVRESHTVKLSGS